MESQPLVITVTRGYKETVSSQSSLSDFSQNTNPITEVKSYLHVSKKSLIDEKRIPRSIAYCSFKYSKYSSKDYQTLKLLNLILQTPRKELQNID